MKPSLLLLNFRVMAKRDETGDHIIKDCDRLSQPKTPTTMNELAKLQHEAVFYLLRRGPEFDAIRQKVEELRFQYGHPPIWQSSDTSQLLDLPIVPASWSAAGPSKAEALVSEYISRVLNELKNLLLIAKARKKSTAPANRPKDPDRLKRWKAIRTAYAKCHGKRKYIESVCRDLQTAKIRMPQRWLDSWNAKGQRIEICDWLSAYRNSIAQSGIQKYISKICRTETSGKPT
jgi:hypothetical protein